MNFKKEFELFKENLKNDPNCTEEEKLSIIEGLEKLFNLDNDNENNNYDERTLYECYPPYPLYPPEM